VTTPEEDISASERATIAGTLLRLGFLSGAGDAEESAIVEALATILPPEREIGVCVAYSGFSSTQAWQFEQRTCSFLRVPPAVPASRLGRVTSMSPSQLIPTMKIVLCTREELLWTTSRVKAGDGVVVEEVVTACLAPVGQILGAKVTGRHEDVVDVWVEDGPTLSFHTEPAEAQALQAYVDTIASSS
jgi:hypothetical protein